MSDAVQGNATRLQQTGETARAEASATAGQAKQAAGQVAGTAADQARAVAGEAQRQAGVVAQDLWGRAWDEADAQAKRAAGTLRHWADDLAGMAEKAESGSPARSLAAQAADGGHRAADYLDRQGVEGVISEVQDFARRRPGAFLGGALLAGLAVGRLVKVAAKADQSSGDGQRTSSGDGQPPFHGDGQPSFSGTPGTARGATRSAPGGATQGPPVVPPSVGTPARETPGRPYPEV
ncbi:hypothetical protein J7I94_17410 [Streptomyces sp. ISL-12]|uniref:hypothetical protein n=1 Tax=Streptomyces sp. ISL-12 TaxID=2819177 RepID=UPI001BECBCA8|nr:hypothetical protein [Streptomyces sp. ISL-12]MBT2412329.1 hypothetical protein [Streptomyces sp. ISL-12]